MGQAEASNPDNLSASTVFSRFSVSLWLVPILFVGMFFRAQYLAEFSYWFDESFCLKMAEFPMGELWQRAANDPHPPLFYFFLRGWTAVCGNSILAARMTSFIPGVLAIMGVYLLVREAYWDETSLRYSPIGNYAAVLTSAWVALSPLHILWSYQVRMYALGVAFSAFSGWFQLRALRRPEWPAMNWILFAVTAIGLAYTHVFGMFTVFAQFVFALGYIGLKRDWPEVPTRRYQFVACLCSLACVCLAWLPWLPSFLHQRQLVVDGFWTPPFSWEAVGLMFFNLFDLKRFMAPSPVLGLVLGQACILVLMILLLGRRVGDIYLSMMAGLPFITGIVLSAFSRNILIARYFMFAEIALLAAICMLVCRLPSRVLRAGASVAIVIWLTYLAGLQYRQRELDIQLPGMRGALAHIDATRKSGEPLIVCDPSVFTSVVAHTSRRQEMFTFYPDRPYPFTHGAAVMRDDEYLSADQLQHSNYRSVWTFDGETWDWKVPMPAHWTLLGEKRFQEFDGVYVLRLYSRDDDQVVVR